MVRSKVRKLKDLLVQSYGDDFEILEENYKLLTPPGEHYGSIMLAVDVVIKKDGKKEEILNLVAKIIPVNQMLRVVFNISVTFKKEVWAYLNTIPALIQLQEEYNVPKDKILDIFPKCHGARITLDPNKNEVDEDAAIIFENLKIQGYIMEDRLIGFDYEHAKMIVKDLARLHSVPIALRLLKPHIFEEKLVPALTEGPSLALLPESFRNCVFEHSANIEELKPYSEKIRTFMDRSLKFLQAPRVIKNDSFATLVHSDYWVNNTLILRDKNGNPIKNKIVDLQLLSFDSGVRDLIFFLFTSVINEVLNEHYDDLIRLYHEEFIQNLKYFKLDLEPFSWKAFLNEIEEIAPTEAYHVVVMIKPIFTERNKITNTLEDFQDSDWNREDLLGLAYKEKLKDTILALSRRDWL